MGYSKKDVRTIDNTGGGTKLTSSKLDGTTTEETLIIGDPGSKLSLQTSGTLAINASFSINGVDFFDITAVTTTPASYITHAVSHVKLTRTAGEGYVSLIVIQ